MKKLYRGFPSKLHHTVPPWVEAGNPFHIRIALDRETKQPALAIPRLGDSIIESVRLYEHKQRWHITVFVVMPDHLHGLISFPDQEAMSLVIGDWKRFHTLKNGVAWQQGYFDHRLRDDERGEQLSAKVQYIRNNPVAAGLCKNAEDWPWMYPRIRGAVAI